ncbi:uncharacterized protein LOC129946995 [Eupeodes corollae]|uniref:uncharacterized protein LOC129946995 n=1 Tax=Eupeodes corollae TaxID=290404 RepID=UPI0024913EE2|nr:uncharacterized protein LOC129946995 [Eupeodes corollae]
MKSIVFIPILLLVVILCSFRANAMNVKIFMAKDPRNPGMCTIGNMVVKVGSAIRNPNGKCESLTCHENGQVSTMTCVQSGMRDGCVMGKVINPNAMYPECCNREIKCKTDYFS